MTYIKNREELTSHGYKREREVTLDIIDYALQAADPYWATKELVHLDGRILNVGQLRFNLSQRGNIYVFGMGKATFAIAKALEEILSENISGGIIIVKRGQAGTLRRIKVREASHPLPGRYGWRAAKELVRMAEATKEGDIAFCANTGGSSALAPLPVPEISLGDKRRVTELLLRSGATIREINAVRKHLSSIKGGRMALAIFPAEIINLTVSDVIEDPLDYITGPTVPDTSTFADAVSVLERYNLMHRAPRPIRNYLQMATPELETPKDFSGLPVHTFVLVKSASICEAAAKKAKALGFNSMILTTCLEAESREAGSLFASIGKEIQRHQRPIRPPCAVVAGGESTVVIRGKPGCGGPNQEFIIGAALKFDESDRVVIAAIDSDGTDGPTSIAGGIVDASTVTRARKQGHDIFAYLVHHDTSSILQKLNDAIITGHTGTNVNDLKVMLVS